MGKDNAQLSVPESEKSSICLSKKDPNLVVHSDSLGINFWDVREKNMLFHIPDVCPYKKGLDLKDIILLVANPDKQNDLKM